MICISWITESRFEMNILIVAARFYEDIADELIAGAKEVLEAEGAKAHVIEVPGAFEIPAAIRFAMKSKHKYAGYVALGCVIRGETTHYDYVCVESTRGLMDLAIQKKAAIGNGILTVENKEQAWARASREQKNKGGGAAKACLEMVALKQQYSGKLP